MDEARLADELNELVKQFGGASDPTSKRLEVLAKKAEVNQKELQASVDCLRESLDYLRVCIKYLLLDIEATRGRCRCRRLGRANVSLAQAA